MIFMRGLSLENFYSFQDDLLFALQNRYAYLWDRFLATSGRIWALVHFSKLWNTKYIKVVSFCPTSNRFCFLCYMAQNHAVPFAFSARFYQRAISLPIPGCNLSILPTASSIQTQRISYSWSCWRGRSKFMMCPSPSQFLPVLPPKQANCAKVGPMSSLACLLSYIFS